MSDDFKYTSHEEAEKGYKEAMGMVSRKDEELRSMKSASELDADKIKSQFRAPESYTLPTNLQLDDGTRSKLSELGKNASLTQSQYDVIATQLVKEATQNNQAAQQQATQTQTDLETIPDFASKKELLDTFVGQKYSDAVAPIIKDKLQDKAFFNNMWDERERSVATTSIPSAGTTLDKPFDMNALIAKRKEMIASPHRLELKDEYMAMIEKKASMGK